jgi:signal transduction histidine kinase
VRFEVYCYNKEATFIIRDEGIGIPEKDMPHIYNAFFRASNVGHTMGNGLGLNIAKSCIEAHRGEIAIESEEDKGSSCTVIIPISWNNQAAEK